MMSTRQIVLGSVAALTWVGGAQAADLPVKAKPVSYVKVCDLYGAGFFYVPGTETCIKLGGYVRVNAYFGATGGNVYAGGGAGGTNAFHNRQQTKDFNFRTRAWLTADARSQTAWGTLRSYYALQFTNSGAGDTSTGTAVPRAFIQFAGFTIGRTTSAFDTPDANSSLTNGITTQIGGTTSSSGINAFQYTAQFGGGLSATFAVESSDQRRFAVINASEAGNFFNFATAGAATNSSLGGNSGTGIGSSWPEFVANIDITQKWGSARLVGALHNISGDYYTAGALGAGPGCAAGTPATCGRPGEAWGYAIAAGFTLNDIPGLPGDNFGVTVGYTSGATAYAVNSLTNVSILKGSKLTVGGLADGIYVNNSGIEPVRTWYATAAYQHRWSPTLRSSIYGGFINVSYTGTAKGWICGTGAGAPAGATPSTPAGTGFAGVTNCNPDFNFWQLGSRVFQWTPVSNLSIGLDVVYNRYNSAFAGTAVTPAFGPHPAGVRTLGGNDVWMVGLDIRRNFWP